MNYFSIILALCIYVSIAKDYRLINIKKYPMAHPLNKDEHITLVHIKKTSNLL